ncbi:hypothetical protein [Paraburkholderia fungorum]|uniref:hypothetical protein n=1 Tax=Paraburkholderia fungorum TaxID=134537 RepID=UPI0038BA3BC8
MNLIDPILATTDLSLIFRNPADHHQLRKPGRAKAQQFGLLGFFTSAETANLT